MQETDLKERSVKICNAPIMICMIQAVIAAPCCLPFQKRGVGRTHWGSYETAPTEY